MFLFWPKILKAINQAQNVTVELTGAVCSTSQPASPKVMSLRSSKPDTESCGKTYAIQFKKLLILLLSGRDWSHSLNSLHRVRQPSLSPTRLSMLCWQFLYWRRQTRKFTSTVSVFSVKVTYRLFLFMLVLSKAIVANSGNKKLINYAEKNNLQKQCCPLCRQAIWETGWVGTCQNFASKSLVGNILAHCYQAWNLSLPWLIQRITVPS